MADEEEARARRISQLGYRPQKELVYNSLLPYAPLLDAESERLLPAIRHGLAKSVIFGELKPGCALWTARLIKYIKLYGLKFTKECHIEFIQLIYELIIVPDLEPTKLHKFCTLMILLTKRNHLISPEELTLQWRPLHEVGKRLFSKSTALLGMYHYASQKRNTDDDDNDDVGFNAGGDGPLSIRQLLKSLDLEMPIEQMLDVTSDDYDTLDTTFTTMIQCVRVYFPPTATREILDEFLPRFLPWCHNNQDVMQDLVLFLPTAFMTKDIDQGFKLWVDDFMLIWKVCHNSPIWESDLLNLMASVSYNNIGRIDWEPYIPWMFTKFLRSFNLPVFYKQTQNNRHHCFDITGMSLWIVSILGPKSSGQAYLNNFMTTVATYLHSANSGRWSARLRELLKKLPSQFVNRVHKERSNYKITWEQKTPEEFLLTDDDITKFVECMSEVALQAMFSRSGVSDACFALQQLALLRPSMVVAPVIEKMWSTVDSLTEPHKLTCAMQCVIAVARPMASGFTNGYSAGPTHIIPLLVSCLPGLDPNDFRKTLVTLNFISVFATLIPIVDCSGASEHWELTEDEHNVCESTAQFEDFVIQYFERVFVLIESSSMENTRMEQKDVKYCKSKTESASEGALTSASVSILAQASTKIFRLALRKFFNFVTQRVLEINVAGHMAASLCKGFSRTNAAETFKVFIPHLCDSILNLIADNEEALKEENLDKELLYHILLLSQVVEKNGTDLLPYMPQIFTVLDKMLKIVSKEGYMLVCNMLRHIITSLSLVYPERCRSSTGDYDANVKDFLAIREWGKPGCVWKCDIKWHIPTEEEILCVERMLHRYLIPELDMLNLYINDDGEVSRDRLNKCLSIVKSLLAANALMPPASAKSVKLVDTITPWEGFNLSTGVSYTIKMPNGTNIRRVVQKIMHALQVKLLNSSEDDTRSLRKLIAIWELLLMHNSYHTSLFETHLKVFNLVKKSLEDRLVGRPGHLRAILAERAILQHEFRVQATSGPINESQAEIMVDLLTLSTSRYSEIRCQAQGRLYWMVANYAYSLEVILPLLVENLRADAETEHERLKGALYCLLGPKQTPIISKHDWRIVGALWPALINSTPSEKPSVVRLMESLLRVIIMQFPTITVKLKWSDSCVEKAKKLLDESQLNDPEFLELLKRSDQIVEKISDNNVLEYNKLLDVILDGAASTQLHWRHSLMCVSILPTLVHADVPYPSKAIKLILRCLIHDSILIRKLAVKLMVFVLKQRKKTHTYVDVDSSVYTGISSDEENRKLIPGFRSDNLWLQYDASKELKKDSWDNEPYTHKDSLGFYYWPKTFKMYAPCKEQPEYTCTDYLNEGEAEIYEFFMTKENVDKFINYFSMEDKKGKDKFANIRFVMYKGLFSNYVDAFMPTFIDHLKTLVCDKQEAMQRCAAEIIAGMVRATKHWPYDKMIKLKEQLTPILQLVFENMTSETFNDWATCFAVCVENMDVSRVGWILQLLEEGMSKDSSSGQLCGQLFLLQAAIIQHPWRFSAYSNDLLKKLEDKELICHPYQNVRDRIASLMSGLFEKDIIYPGGKQDVAPSISKFIDKITPQLDMLFVEGLKNGNNSSGHRVLSALSFSGNTDSYIGTDDNSNDNPSSMSPMSNKIKFMIQDTMNKVGMDKNNINMGMISKLVQDVKKSNLAGEMGKDCDAESSSILKRYLTANNHKTENMSYLGDMEEKLTSVLKISEDDILGGISQLNIGPKEDTQNDINIRLFKTVLKWITATIFRSPFGSCQSYYAAVPAACVLGTRDGDEELYQVCAAFLSTLAESLHNQESLTVAFNTVDKICKTSSWCARVSCLSFLQSLIFHNMAFIVDGPFVANIKQVTLQLMADLSPEVREAAAVMLAGLLHCEIFAETQDLLDHFKSLCKGGRLNKAQNTADNVARRHCGVLGLCAFIAAQPYTVPSYLPELFSLLGRHLNDPQPIPATIHKTLGDFKRTHHSDWQTHQLKFTEDELSLLSDLTVPPSHYA